MDNKTIADLYKKLIRSCYLKIEKKYKREFKVDKGLVENAFHEVFINLAKKISKDDISDLSQFNTCGYMMQGVRNYLLKGTKKTTKELVTGRIIEEYEAGFEVEVHSISLREAILLALDEMGDDCTNLLKINFNERSKIRPIGDKGNLQGDIWDCICIFLPKVNYHATEAGKDELELLVGKGLQLLDQRCQRIIKGYYYEKISLKELAKEFNLKYGTMKNNRQSCFEKLQQCIFNLLVDQYHGYTLTENHQTSSQ